MKYKNILLVIAEEVVLFCTAVVNINCVVFPLVVVGVVDVVTVVLLILNYQFNLKGGLT